MVDDLGVINPIYEPSNMFFFQILVTPTHAVIRPESSFQTTIAWGGSNHD